MFGLSIFGWTVRTSSQGFLEDEMNYTFYSDFPTEPIGKPNPYRKCSFCGRSVPEINYTLSGHHKHCRYRQQLEDLGCTDEKDVRKENGK